MPEKSSRNLIFDELTLRKLEQLALVAERVRVGQYKGDRRSRKRGSSIEYADYRNYVQGDDLRRLDWNVLARLERPMIKLLEEEEDLAVHLFIDTSASMAWPVEPASENKFFYALRLAAALGYIGLSAGDQVTLNLISARQNRSWGPFRGRQNGLRLFQFLEEVQAGGETDLTAALSRYGSRANRPGLAILISDLFSPTGFEAGLQALQARGYEASLIHLLTPAEVDPPLVGDLKLVDVETGAQVEVSLDSPTKNRYRRHLQEWQADIGRFCATRQIHYIPVTTDLAWEKLIFQALRNRDIVR